MGLFTKRKVATQLPEKAQAVASRIANSILSAQCRSAAWLNARAAKLGHKNSLIILIFLGLGFGLWCLYLMLSPLL
jgi:hypothetical protein